MGVGEDSREGMLTSPLVLPVYYYIGHVGVPSPHSFLFGFLGRGIVIQPPPPYKYFPSSLNPSLGP